jgi:hypothetical protein
MRTILLYIAVLGGIIIVSNVAISDPTGSQSCNNSEPTVSYLVNIGDILNNSESYNGELVTIEGMYLGWTGPSTGAQLTRSDWRIKDETGSIYVTGANSGLDPYKDVGVNLIVLGIVHLIDGAPYLEGRAISLIDAYNNTESDPGSR